MNILICTLTTIDTQKELIDGRLHTMLNYFDENAFNQYVQVNKIDNYEEIHKNTSVKIKSIINNVIKTHSEFSSYLQHNLVYQLCSNNSIEAQTNYSQYNNYVNESQYSALYNTTTNCTNLNIVELMIKTSDIGLAHKSSVQYFEMTGNQISYPYTSLQSPASSNTKQILNFYGTKIKFIFPCQSKQKYLNQDFDMNYIIDSEQKFHFNQTHNINESNLTRFISQLSDYKEKIVACYDKQYLTIGDRLQSPGTHDQVLTFIGRNYNETVTTINIESLLDALNRTISQFYFNQQQRIYKRNIPVGSGIGPDGMQIFIQDSEYYETDDQAVQVLKRYEQINQDNLNMLNFQVILFGPQVKRSVANILSRVVFLTRMSISNLSEYIEHQTQHITTLENYTTIPQSVDILGQHAVQICTTVKRFDNKLGGILCTSVPITEMFPSKGISYIIDTRKKMLIANNANIIFNYNYFVTTLQPQHFSHMNQYNRTSIEINGSLYITENITQQQGLFCYLNYELILGAILKLLWGLSQFQAYYPLQPSQELFVCSKISSLGIIQKIATYSLRLLIYSRIQYLVYAFQ
ncbi:Hypothetical_protein [Hexamita inflata]|uniref:Hypothetical_protein n=1 Tax=Hexamita inflata TaxID=28002 RepID=A0AA86V181_9EUKA|nr:Hypothetical protein HINF_LOCUS60076 [Hexamita inflata]